MDSNQNNNNYNRNNKHYCEVIQSNANYTHSSLKQDFCFECGKTKKNN